jgi:hypothetical protein
MRRRRQENDFNLSLHYITEAEARVSRQEQLIVQLKKNGKPTGQAEGALKEYEGSLLQLRNHLVIMQVLMKPD